MKMFARCAVLSLFLWGCGGGQAPEIGQSEPPGDSTLTGTVHATGTYFKAASRMWPDLALRTDRTVSVLLESAPGVISVFFEASPDVVATRAAVTGLAPRTTYYLYEDSFENAATVTSDADGAVTFVQDVTVRHVVYLKQGPSTVLIGGDGGGGCAAVGQWDPVTLTCRLTQDIFDSVSIVAPGVRLDGMGHTVAPGDEFDVIGVHVPAFPAGGLGPVVVSNLVVGEGFTYGLDLAYTRGVVVDSVSVQAETHGIRISGSTDVTVRNCDVSGPLYGVKLAISSEDVVIEAGTFAAQHYTIWADSSSDLLVRHASIRNEKGYAVYVREGTKPVRLIGNTLVGQGSGATAWNRGIYIFQSDPAAGGHLIEGNSIAGFGAGIFLHKTGDNDLVGNFFGSNAEGGCGEPANLWGVRMNDSDNNRIQSNTFCSSKEWNVEIYLSDRNTVSRNSFYKGTKGQVSYVSGTENDFFQPGYLAGGGNFWSEHLNVGGTYPLICSTAYLVAPGVYDELPWVKANGWYNFPPELTISEPDGGPADAVSAQEGETITLALRAQDTVGDNDEGRLDFEVCWAGNPDLAAQEGGCSLLLATPVAEGEDLWETTWEWTPGYGDAGVYTLHFFARDGAGEIDGPGSVTVSVGDVNRPPTFEGLATVLSVTCPAGGAQCVPAPLGFGVVAGDPDEADRVEIYPCEAVVHDTGEVGCTEGTALGGVLPAATFASSPGNPGVGTFSWTPTAQDEGAYTLRFSAVDDAEVPGVAWVAVFVTVEAERSVENPIETAQALENYVRSIGRELDQDVFNSYIANLKKVVAFLQRGRVVEAVGQLEGFRAMIAPAVNQLDAFVIKVRQDLAHEAVAVAAGTTLLAEAERLLGTLRNGPGRPGVEPGG